MTCPASSAVRHIGLAAAVLGARVRVRNAAVVLEQMGRLKPRLREEALETLWAGFLQIATDHGPHEIGSLREKIIATYGRQGEFQRHHDQLKHGVCLSQPVHDDEMALYRLRLDPEGREVLESIPGPLAAPQPTGACANLRSADQRRGEALPTRLDRHRHRHHHQRSHLAPVNTRPTAHPHRRAHRHACTTAAR